MSGSVQPLRVTFCNKAPMNPGGDFVLYWMTAFRRVSWNFALDQAVEWARELQKPLLVLETLRGVGFGVAKLLTNLIAHLEAHFNALMGL